MEASQPSARRLVIALDIDDTITAHPAFFAFLSQSAIAAGHEVLIITFREDRVAAESDLRALGIVWSKLITSTVVEHLEHGIDEWKGWVCREHAVDIFFDDMPEVMEHVDERVTKCLIG